MGLAEVKKLITDRLDEADRGDRGWWIVTRVHVAASWLHGLARYLHNQTGSSPLTLGSIDYQAMARVVGIATSNPGQELRRHHLLAMYRPLGLIERIPPNRWSKKIQLTDAGCNLAASANPASVLEDILWEMRFAVEPWATSGRAEEYAEFNVPVYHAAMEVLGRSDGYIDRDEFDFFVSRIRSEREIDWACNGIRLYRNLSPTDQNSLHTEVKSRIPLGAGKNRHKPYSNWRDIGLHTFSLFSLGTSMVRQERRLMLVGTWAESPAIGPERQRRHTASRAALKLPEPPEADELLVPPASAAANDGTDAEALVAKVLTSQGWQVAFYTNRRGYGFDLWARKDKRAMLLEVKSSTKRLDSIVLTPVEYAAAKKHRASYVLACVEHIGSDAPMIHMIADPIGSLDIAQKESKQYTITRASWSKAVCATGQVNTK